MKKQKSVRFDSSIKIHDENNNESIRYEDVRWDDLVAKEKEAKCENHYIVEVPEENEEIDNNDDGGRVDDESDESEQESDENQRDDPLRTQHSPLVNVQQIDVRSWSFFLGLNEYFEGLFSRHENENDDGGVHERSSSRGT